MRWETGVVLWGLSPDPWKLPGSSSDVKGKGICLWNPSFHLRAVTKSPKLSPELLLTNVIDYQLKVGDGGLSASGGLWSGWRLLLSREHSCSPEDPRHPLAPRLWLTVVSLTPALNLSFPRCTVRGLTVGSLIDRTH
jgi:hypothetical protein